MSSSRRWARRAIWLIVVAAVLRSLVWAVVIPPWQGPDEGAHYSYIERIAVEHSIPPLASGQPNAYSAALSGSTASNAFGQWVTHQTLRPLRRDMNAFPAEPRNLSARGGGTLEVGRYPPAYYLLGAIAYDLPGLHTASARLYSIRVLTAFLGGLLAFLVFRIFLVAGVPELLSLLGTAAFMQLPMVTQTSAIVNPDIMLLVGAAGLTASVLRARIELTRRSLVFVLLWGLLTALSKPIGTPTVIILVTALLGLGTEGTAWRRRGAVVAVLAAFFVALAAYGRPAGIGPLTLFRYSTSYLWQFYLPKLPFQSPGPYVGRYAPLPSWWVWIETGIGRFGWLTTPLPTWAYQLGALTLLGAALVAAFGFARRPRLDVRVAAALLVAALGYTLLLHLSEIVLVIGNGGLLLQGRYLLPVVPLFEAVLLLGLARLGRIGLATAGALVAVTFVISVQAVESTLVFFG